MLCWAVLLRKVCCIQAHLFKRRPDGDVEVPVRRPDGDVELQDAGEPLLFFFGGHSFSPYNTNSLL